MSWIIQGNTAGSYSLSVTATGAEFSNSGSTTLTVNTPANVILQSSDCDSDADLSDDEEFEASFVVRNTGGIDATISGTPTYTGCSFTVARTGTLSSSSNSISLDAGQTKTINIDEADKTKGTAKFSNSDNEGVDSVAIGFANEITKDLTLKLNNTPDLTASDFKVISGHTVKQYFQFTYTAESTVKSADIKFSLPKTKVTDVTKVKLARLNNSVWTYYTPVMLDVGTYYQFTANVPGFSYFAIVEYNEAAGVPGEVVSGTPKVEGTTDAGKKTTGAETTEPSTTQEPSTQNPEPETSGLVWWVWLIIAVAVIVIVVIVIMDLRK